MSKVRKAYTTSQKLEVIDFAKGQSVTKAADRFGVSKSMVSRWKANESTLRQASLNAKKLGSGPSPSFPSEEKRLFDEFVQKQSLGQTVSCKELQKTMRSLVNQQRFRASTGWLYGFRRRHNVTATKASKSASKKAPCQQQQSD